jgi:hypothetical protein
MRDKTGAQKDFFRVAVVVSRETLSQRMQEIDLMRKKILAKLEKPKGANTAKKHQEEELQRRKNVVTFTQILPRVFQVVRGNPLISCQRKGLSFSILGVPTEEQPTLCALLSSLSGGAIKTALSDEQIIFQLPKGFFGQNPTHGNEKKFWKSFCDEVEARWPRPANQILARL